MRSDLCLTEFHNNSDSAKFTKVTLLSVFDKLIVLAQKFTCKLIQEMRSLPSCV